MIVLDTNVLSEPLRPSPDAAVTRWLDDQAIETLYLTAVTLAEIRFGIAALPEGRRRTRLDDRFESELVPLFEGRVLTFDEPASRQYAALRASARRRGSAIGDFDALIAAIANAHGHAVATRDTAPFESLRVPTINPFAPE